MCKQEAQLGIWCPRPDKCLAKFLAIGQGLSWGTNQVFEFPGWGVRRALERRAAARRTADITPWDILKEAESSRIELAVATQISQMGASLHVSPVSQGSWFGTGWRDIWNSTWVVIVVDQEDPGTQF